MNPSAAIIPDPIYGEIKITHPLVLQILASPSFQRLKSIDMAGYSAGFYPGTSHSRFEHSVGVFHLLSIQGARLEECLHGLLHDISHTAFSHAVDYALAGASGKNQDFQDRIFHTFVQKTEIPGLLSDFGFAADDIFDSDHFPLQEKSIPNLCADRLDYSLRGFFHYRILPLAEIQNLLKSLSNNGQDWFFLTRAAAQTYASAFAELDDRVFDSLRSAAMFRSVGDCLKQAMKTELLSMDDLFGTEEEVLVKLKSGVKSDSLLAQLWERMSGHVPYKDDPNDYEAVVHCKSRIVDPLFVNEEGRLTRLSTVSTDWRQALEEGLKPKTYYLKFGPF